MPEFKQMLDHIEPHLAEADESYLHMKSPFLGVVTRAGDYWFHPPVNNHETQATQTRNTDLHSKTTSKKFHRQ
jgi:hypothetical protein